MYINVCIPQGHPRLVNTLANMYGKLMARKIDPMNEVYTYI